VPVFLIQEFEDESSCREISRLSYLETNLNPKKVKCFFFPKMQAHRRNHPRAQIPDTVFEPPEE